MPTNMRYIVDSTSDLKVYELLGFRVVMHPGPGFAALERDGVMLYLNVPGGGAERVSRSEASCRSQAAGIGSRSRSTRWTRPWPV